MWEIEARFCARERRKRGRVRLSRALDGKKGKKWAGEAFGVCVVCVRLCS